jgi:hypothetical protein
VSRKHGCLLGSHNKKTLAALVAAAAAVSAEAAPATTAAAVSAEVAAAATTAAASIGAAPAATAAAAAGDSSGAVAGAARKSRRPPEKQRLTYTSANVYTTFLAPLRVGCEVRLPLPFWFVDTMGGNVLTHAIMEECSGGQPLYPIEVFHNGEGKSYLRDRSHFFCVRVIDSSYCACAYSAWA